MIDYDLDKPDKNYPLVLAKMKEIKAVRVLFSQWYWLGDATIEQVNAAVSGVFDSNDRYLVTQVSEFRGRNLMASLPESW